jgi:hypothetical protein
MGNAAAVVGTFPVAGGALGGGNCYLYIFLLFCRLLYYLILKHFLYLSMTFKSYGILYCLPQELSTSHFYNYYHTVLYSSFCIKYFHDFL